MKTETQLQQLNDVQYTMQELKEKLTNRKVWKGRDGWQAKTTVKDIKGYDWEITTFKGHSGVVCVAQAGKIKEEDWYSTFSFAMFSDPRMTLKQVNVRATEKSIGDVHTKGLQEFVNKLDLNSFKPTYN